MLPNSYYDVDFTEEHDYNRYCPCNHESNRAALREILDEMKAENPDKELIMENLAIIAENYGVSHAV